MSELKHLSPSAPIRRFLRPAALTAVVFFSVSGGPYGLEPVLNFVGASRALLLIVITGLLWSVPAILMVLELNGMMPRNGGYYQWVKAGLGPSWGFLEGWWTWMFMLVDLAIYPVLFVQYSSFFFPGITTYRYLLCLLIIWAGAGLNLLGILPVGRSSMVFGTAVMLPFGVLFLVAFAPGAPPGTEVPLQGGVPSFTAFGMGLFTVMWNLLGWDNSTTFVEEVERPSRSYLLAMAAAFLLILGTYLGAILVAARAGMNPSTLEEEGFPSLGLLLGGPPLAGLLSAGGMASALGLFVANLLSISRIPKAMADDHYLPEALSRINSRHNVPHVTIVVCALVVSLMVLWDFEDLLIIDVMLYGCALLLEFFALISLRRSQPHASRPFRIPLGQVGLSVMALLPTACFITAVAAIALHESIHTNAFLFSVAAVLTGPAVWRVVRHA